MKKLKMIFKASLSIIRKPLILIYGLMMILSQQVLGQTSPQTFTSNGTFTVPAGVTSVTVECWGAGGRGGTRSSNGVGGGGGGGAYSQSIVSVTPGQAYTVVVGQGSSSTSAGGDSYFINITTVMAKGGSSAADNSATGALGGLASSSVGTVKFNGGRGADGVSGTGGGGGGSSAGTAAAGVYLTQTSNTNGATAPSGGGNGGNGRLSSNGSGSNGSGPGGGGGGAFRTSGTRTGGTGANGQVKISWSTANTLTISNPTTLVSTASICTPSSNVQIHRFKITGSGGGGTLTNFSFTTTGTYTVSDITNFKIWHNTSDDFATASLLGTQSSPAGPGSQTFSAFSTAMGNETKFFWITADIPTGAIAGRTIAVSASASSNMTTTASKAGTTSASGTQTFLAPFVPTITPSSASICPGQSVTLNSNAPSTTASFSQNTSVTINTLGAASPYPSTLTVNELPTSGVTVKRVFINGFSHTFPSDADLLLQSPSGTNVIIMADAGEGTDASGLNYVFQDGANAMITTGLNASGTYRCTSGDGTAENFSSPGPGSINQSNPLLSSFTGNMNGTWNLYVIDDASGDGGSITSWSIEFEIPPYNWSPSAGLNTTTGNTVIASPSSTTTYTLTPPAGVCATSATATVTVSGTTPSDPSNITATTPSLIKIGGTVSFSADGNGATLRWYDAATGGTLLGTGSTFTTPVQCTPGNDTIYVETFNGSCSSSRFPASFTVRPLITSNPENGLICSAGGSVDLTANVTNGSSLSWTPSTGLSSTNSLLTTASPAATTQYTFSSTVTGCGSVSGTFNVGVIEGAAFTPSASPSSVCAGGNVTLNSNLNSSNFSVGSITYAPADPANATSSVTALVNNGVAGVNLSGGSLDDGGWGGIPIGFNYNFFGNNYSSLGVGTNGLIQFGTISGYGTAQGQLGQYSFVLTPQVFPNTSNPGNVIAWLANDLIWSNTTENNSLRYWNDGIAPTRRFILEAKNVRNYDAALSLSTVQIILYETTGIVEIHVTNTSGSTPASNEANNKKTIGLQDATQTIGAVAPGRQAYTAAITTPEAWRFSPAANYSFQWLEAGSAISNATNSNYSLTSSTTPGTYNYSVQTTNPNTGCATTKSVSFTVNAIPSAPVATTSITVCQNATAPVLSATAGSGNTLLWYTQPTGGTGSTTVPTVSTSSNGVQNFYVSQRSADNCESSRTQITVTVNAAPATPAVTSPVSYCQGAVASALSATSGAGTTLSWYTTPTGGTGSSTAITPSTATTGSTSYYVSAVSNSNSCESTRATITVNINATPAAPTVTSPVTYCQGDASSALTATGSNLNWYTVQTGGTALGSAPVPSTATAATTNYFVDQTVSGCTSSRSQIQVTVNPTLTPAISVSASSTSACSGGSITFTATPTTGGSNPTYQWYLNNNAVSGQTGETYVLSSPANGDQIYATMVSNATGCLSTNNATGNTITLTSSASTPSVTISSNSATTICPGTSVTFSVNSSANMGSNPTYQWAINGSPVTNETSSTFTTSALATNDQVSLTMTSSLDQACLTTSSATSSNITFTLNAATTVSSQPASQTACAGTNASFSVTADGQGTLSYQWKKNGTNISNNATAQTSQLTLSSVTSSDAANYTVEVTGGCGSVTSSSASLSLNASTSINTQPSSATQCQGTNASFSVTGSGQGTLSYQWRKSGININGATDPTLTLNSISSSDAASYSVVVTGGCGSVNSSNASLTVNPSTTISTQPSAVTVCSGNTANFSVSASGTTPLSYQWNLNGNPVNGATSSTFSISSPQANNAGQYTVTITGGCGSITSSQAALTVNSAPSISSQPAIVAACDGSSATFNVTAAGSGNLTYQWKFGASNISGATSASYTIPMVMTSDAGSYSVSVTGTCGTLNSAPALLTINANPAAPSITNSGTSTFCSNESRTLTSSSATSYLWSTGAATQQISVNTTNSYTVTIFDANGCSANSAPFTITVNANPSLTTSAISSNCDAASVDLSSGITSSTSGLTIGYFSDAALSNSISATVSQTGTYYILATNNNSCTASQSIAVAMNVSPTTANAGSDQTGSSTCGLTQVTLAANTPALGTGAWSILSGTGGSFGNASNAASTFSGIAGNTYLLKWTTTNTACSSSDNVEVTLNQPSSLPSSVTTSQATVCPNGSATLSITGGTLGTGASWTWYSGSCNSTSIGTGPSITVNPSSTTSYFVKAEGLCSTPSCGTVSVNVSSGVTPSNPGGISGPVAVCEGDINKVFSVQPTQNASSYNWTASNGATVTSGQGTRIAGISFPSSFTTSSICVTALNQCNVTSNLTRCITVSALSSYNISQVIGTTSLCVGDSGIVYRINSVGNSTLTYNWTVPAGVNILSGAGTNQIAVQAVSSPSGQICVNITGPCGASNTQCMTVSGSSISMPGGISGPASVCTNTGNLTYSVQPVPGAVSYTWSLPSGFTINSGQGSRIINVSTGSSLPASGVLSVFATSSCGANSSIRQTTVNNSQIAPSSITGPGNVCSGINGVSYTSATVSSATSYQWTLPSGITASSGINSQNLVADISPSFVQGDICVTAVSSCGTSAPACRTIRNFSLVTPGGISGPATACPGQNNLTYSVQPVEGAVSYVWNLPAGMTIVSGSGTRIITVNTGAGLVSGNVCVTAVGSCGTQSLPRCTQVKLFTEAVPSNISSPVVVCPGNSNVNFSITPMNGATSYQWSLPSGVTFTNSSGTNTSAVSVNVSNSFTSGTVCVVGVSPCGNSQSACKTIGDLSGVTPGGISGPVIVCQGGSNNQYSVQPVAGAESYEWIVPAGMSITNGQGTGIINVSVSSQFTSGDIGVRAIACGVKSITRWTGSISITPAAPGTISWTSSICASSNTTLSVPPVSGAATYEWTLPSGVSFAGGTVNSASVEVSFAAGFVQGDVCVRAVSACGYGGYLSCQTIGIVPSTPGVITGPSGVCPLASGLTYSISAVPGAASYVWTVPAGWHINSGNGTASISVDVPSTFSTGQITVAALSSCGQKSGLRILNIGAAPAAPGTMSGPTAICQGNTYSYSVPTVPGASSYTWSLPSGVTLATGDPGNGNSINVDVNSNYNGGSLCVVANTACGGTSISRCITLGTTNAAPGVITGPRAVCPGAGFLTYSVSGTGNFQWTVPTGFTILSGQGTNSISLSAPASFTSDQICVQSLNACGTPGASSCLNISSTPPAATAISVAGNFCPGSTRSLSVAAVSGVTGYTWTVPAGLTIVGGQGTSSILVEIGTNYSPGQVCVTATSSCQSSAVYCQTINISTPSAATNIVTPAALCANSTAVFGVPATTGAGSFNWTVSGGMTITSGQGTPIITTSIGSGFTSGSVCVTSVSGCALPGTQYCKSFTSTPATPGTITAPTPVCGNQNEVVLSVAPVQGASSYEWTLPAGLTAVAGSGTSAITVNSGPGFTGGTVTVKAVSACGTLSAARTLALSSAPASPGTISIPAAVCANGTGYVFSVTPVVGAVSYNWTFPSGYSIVSGSGTHSVTVNTGTVIANGSVCVSATSVCGSTSTNSCQAIINLPATPGGVSGSANGVCNSTLQYSVQPVTGATGYTWSVIGTGANIVSGQGTRIIQVAFDNNFTSCQLSVVATNSCGNSATRTSGIITGAPGTPASITASGPACPSQSISFTAASSFGATGYNWTLPTTGSPAAVINSGQGTNIVNATWGSVGGTVAVTASNSCGTSAPRSISVSLGSCRMENVNTNEISLLEAFPVPAHEEVILRFHTDDVASYTLELFDLKGQLVKSRQEISTPGKNLFVMDVRTLESGIYLMKLRGSNGQFGTVRIVVK